MERIPAGHSDSYIFVQKNNNRPIDADLLIDNYNSISDELANFLQRNNNAYINGLLDKLKKGSHEICIIREGSSSMYKSEFDVLIANLYRNYFILLNYFDSMDQKTFINMRREAKSIATRFTKLATEPPLL